MEEQKKEARYGRILKQLKDLTAKSNDPVARMATICAVLHHKMDYYFWTGFYLLKDGDLIVGPYQGPVACQVLERERGICWAAVKGDGPVVVRDVHEFPGHIACDSRSQSEITIPVKDSSGKTVAVFDVDGKEKNRFSETDARHLTDIVALIYG